MNKILDSHAVPDEAIVGEWQDIRCLEEKTSADGRLSQLCNACKYIFNSSETWAKIEPASVISKYFKTAKCRHLQNTSSLTISAARGCTLCSLVSKLIERDMNREESIFTGDLYYSFELDDPDTDRYIAMWFDYKRKTKYERQPSEQSLYLGLEPTNSLDSRLYLKAGEVIPTRSLDHSPESLSDTIGSANRPRIALKISPQTWDASSLELAQMWLEQCRKSHQVCNLKRMKATGYPTRLLDLGSLAGEPHVRLVDARHVFKPITYLALSHCWGGDVPVMLRLDTIGQFRKGIDIEVLPTSFKHAIEISKALSVRYLWIDSLCILQDSRQDWEQEASKMKTVYTNSLLTVAATGAEHSAQGMKFQIDPALVQPVNIDLSQCLKPYCIRGTYALFDATSWEANVDLAPLSARAWAVQERLLSPCVLHFGAEQIAWQCLEFQACTVFPGGLPKIFKYTSQAEFQRLLPSNSERLNSQWKKIVEIYSQCKLTQESDIQVALAGVAEVFQSWAKNDTFVAGFWAGKLVPQLCWTTNFPENDMRHLTPCRPVKYRAPSWSWMSVKSSISFYTPNSSFRPLFEVLDHDVQTENGHEFGIIKSGHLRGRGVLRHAMWGRPATSKFKMLWVDGSYVLCEGSWSYGMGSARVIMDIGQDELSGNVMCLPLIDDTKADNGFYIGLILKEAHERPKEYRRVGCFEFHNSLGDRLFPNERSEVEETAMEMIDLTIV